MTLPDTMTCIEIAEPGGPEVLRPVRRPVPRPGPGEVLLRVAAAGINRPDLLQRRGVYPPPADASDLPGLEAAGTVAAVGDGVTAWRIGETVCALCPGGGYAEYCVVPAAHCLPVPAGLCPAEAAALPETCFTVWFNVFERAALTSGETLLVHGGAGGIGTTAIQMARALGARVIATAGSPERCALCLELGAERAVDYTTEDFVEAAKAFTGGRGVDVVLDMLGGAYVQRNIKALAVDGRLAMIAFLEGARVEVDLAPVLLKRLTLTASTLRALPDERKANLARGLRDTVWPRIEAGAIRPRIHAVLPLPEAAEAHRLMEARGHAGKIVLVTDGTAPPPLREV